jgi:hypothetical protein
MWGEEKFELVHIPYGTTASNISTSGITPSYIGQLHYPQIETNTCLAAQVWKKISFALSPPLFTGIQCHRKALEANA